MVLGQVGTALIAMIDWLKVIVSGGNLIITIPKNRSTFVGETQD